MLRGRAVRRLAFAGSPPVLTVWWGLTRLFAYGPASLVEAARRGLLYGPAVNQLTLMNYVNPGAVRALEWLGSLVPELPHL